MMDSLLPIDKAVVDITKSMPSLFISLNSSTEQVFSTKILGNSFISLILSILLVPIPLEHTIMVLNKFSLLFALLIFSKEAAMCIVRKLTSSSLSFFPKLFSK